MFSPTISSADNPPANTEAASLSQETLAHIFTPRDENDVELDTEGLLEKDTAAVFPKPPDPTQGDAFDNMMSLMSNPPVYLSEGDVRRMVHYFEWALEAPLINSERNELRKLLIDGHNKDAGASSRAYQFLAQGIGFKLGDVYMDALSNPLEEWKRQDIQREYLPLLQREAKNGDALAQWLINRYNAIQIPLTAGAKPLRPQVVKAYVDHVVFCVNEIAGANPEEPVIKPTPEIQLKIAQQLIATWPTLPQAKRDELVSLPFDWANTLKEWPSKSEVEKTKARIAWGKQFTPLFPELATAHQARVAAFEQAEAEAKAEQAKHAKDEAERLAKLTPEQRAAEALANQQMLDNIMLMSMQNQMQTQQQNFQMLSNMQQSFHETNMDIIRNMDGRTWTYEYVYRP